MEKNKQQWIINIILMLLIASYAFTFNSIIARITKNETRIEQLNPIFLQIQKDLVEIKSDLKWLKGEK